ncbi:tRNA (guanosine(46)-N7)-methyltransferase TrmB [Vagococcus intermedius]|uniref:tRNA (guanine-N(7)-)-methyltransferase n=1 Tax=Vagococcus intermedius TaxID=2991418 RepID=A0AAF0I7W9_9ENTE|nr:tRNA (guanosine(46)-N7)-methyltransferase TrmB [Vagococcus intermedius]WEG73725.1 tRNA (guanosine(46)-N7)-methyltransferase TrmB [Vagococcus intermedius]WEG75810.1 tRNA (guanosine(46)-N7)-methyltransferase TrmB [Vagococcus intermedius]
MRVRNKPWAKDRILEYPQYVVSDPENWKGRWQQRFKQEQPIHIEVGTGKGQFITEMAKANPDINYIGIEIEMSVLVVALDKLIAEELPNLQLLHADGRDLTDYFEKGEISLLYLNFSDPWPKTKHAKRRLTYKTFLATFEKILPDNGEIHFKTDNQGLFEYSLGSFSQYGMIIKQVWLDLHTSSYEGNIMTEYEEKFSSRGQRIYRVEAYFPK